ncbi:hypothetical protein NOVOSPHI9U_770055 [Novosphingobium sp. 9U]|nr:hypothetical protein NOVOSPHI9U_770055 [Novosphingobium sp. 9U]
MLADIALPLTPRELVALAKEASKREVNCFKRAVNSSRCSAACDIARVKDSTLSDAIRHRFRMC